MQTKTKITDYELLDHGIDHAQYFQGCGTAFTKFDHVVTGCGSNFAEALDDALDIVAQDGFDADELDFRMRIDEDLQEWPTEPNTDKYHEENEDSEMYYYVSIRWN